MLSTQESKLANIKTLISSIIVYDKSAKKQLSFGYNCNNHSKYDLNVHTKDWFENLIRDNLNISTIAPKFISEVPDQFPNVLISVMNFNKYLIVLMMDNINEGYVDQIRQISLIELLMLMQKSLMKDLENDDLTQFVHFKSAHDCGTCNTINTCFPKFSLDNRLL